ncbi:MAG: RNA-directed DNA polymerase [Alphaproteobacteria bacterium]|nr:RNA-directed DNA polymerase [Alphaproteobacteria bacterium]
MQNWNSQLFSKGAAAAGVSPSIIASANAYARRIISCNSDLPIVFTLKHFAHLTELPFDNLVKIVERKEDPYRSFLIKKRSRPGDRAVARRYRTICIPDTTLMFAQRWIDQKILSKVDPHNCSTAFHGNSSIVRAAQRHCGCRWLIKIDIQRFFESITESSVCRVFQSLGYPDLLSFELGRLCTREPSVLSRRWKFRRTRSYPSGVHQHPSIGFLPQGSPTSPRLANLTMREFDEGVNSISRSYGLVYSRYADDLIFSTDAATFSRVEAEALISRIYQVLLEYGFEPNRTKTMISPPRARKIVLGLLVDRDTPKLTRQFKQDLENHVFYLSHPRHGPSQHANKRNFTSVIGLQNYVQGLLAHAAQVDSAFADRMRAMLAQVKWPI